jgi:hypothetical protein
VDKDTRLGGRSSQLVRFLGTMLGSGIAAQSGDRAFASRFFALNCRWT